jgi:hypothetical protein
LTSSLHGDIPAQPSHAGPGDGGIKGIVKRDKFSRRGGPVQHAAAHPALGGVDEAAMPPSNAHSTLLLLF